MLENKCVSLFIPPHVFIPGAFETFLNEKEKCIDSLKASTDKCDQSTINWEVTAAYQIIK